MMCSLLLLITFLQTSRSEKNVVRDENRRLRLGKIKVTKKLFVKNGTGAERYAKSETICAIP